MSLDGTLPPGAGRRRPPGRDPRAVRGVPATDRPGPCGRVAAVRGRDPRPGLLRLAELLKSAALLDAALDDPGARLLLGLYGLDPSADDSRSADEVPGVDCPCRPKDPRRTPGTPGRVARRDGANGAILPGRVAMAELPVVTGATSAVPGASERIRAAVEYQGQPPAATGMAGGIPRGSHAAERDRRRPSRG